MTEEIKKQTELYKEIIEALYEGFVDKLFEVNNSNENKNGETL